MSLPTKPALWKLITKKYRASKKGGDKGRWSAEKAALAKLQYKKKGGEWKKVKAPAPPKP